MQGLSLTEYSNKYRVSISTLRRKIKSGKISFNLKSGKYFLADQSPEKKKNKVFAGEQALDSRASLSRGRAFCVKDKGSSAGEKDGMVKKRHMGSSAGEKGGMAHKGQPVKSFVAEKALQKECLADLEKEEPFSANKDHKTLSDLEEPKAKAVTSGKSDLLEREDQARFSGTDLKLKDSGFASSQAVLSKLVDSQRELLKQVEKKDEIINLQKDKIADLSTLTAFLEKENRQLKSLLHEEKQIEEWLEAPL